jgi:hypothetical protein
MPRPSPPSCRQKSLGGKHSGFAVSVAMAKTDAATGCEIQRKSALHLTLGGTNC